MKSLILILVGVASSGAFTPSSIFTPHSRAHQFPTRRRRSNNNINIYMGMQVKIHIVGRNKSGSDDWLEDAFDMYTTRLRASPLSIDTVWHKNNEALVKAVHADLDKQHTVVLLDIHGKQYTSEAFAKQVFEWLNRGGSRLSFCIGGAKGLPKELLQLRQLPRVSFSKMTFTHQFARIMLTEQVYRATEIRKGSGYHK